MSEKSGIVDAYGRPYSSEEESSSDIRAILGEGYGEVISEHDGGVEIRGADREDEAIIGEAAREFAVEAAMHPERYRYIAEYVKRAIEKHRIQDPLIMDFGAGPGILTAMIAEELPTARVIGVDLSADMISIARENIEAEGLEKRIQLVHHNVKDVYGNAAELADMVVSRNMLHRFDNPLQEGLMSMARAAKEKGGMVFNTSFRRLDDPAPGMAERQEQWKKDLQERKQYFAEKDDEDGKGLIDAWILAYIHAPTLEQYQVAAAQVAEQIGAEECEVREGRNNSVEVFIRRRS